MYLLKILFELVKYFVPLTYTKEMALEADYQLSTGYLSQDLDDYDLVAPMDEILLGEVYDAVVLASYISWLEWAFCIRQQSPIKPWPGEEAMSRLYLVSGFFTNPGFPFQLMSGTATLEDGEVMDQQTLRKVQSLLLAEINAVLPSELAFKSMSITHFQPFETAPPATQPVLEETLHFNDCGTVLPPVDSPVLIEVAPGVVLRALRPEFAERRGDQLLFNLQGGGQFIGRPRWTHP